MIIVEGADNCGKSTLVKQLIELDPTLRILHRDRYNPNKPGDSIGLSYLSALIPPDDDDRVAHGNSIADRLMASECIYGDLYRQGCRMTPREHLLVKSVLQSYGAFVIWCDTDDHTILQTWNKREQLYDRNPLEIVQAYRDRIRNVFRPLQVHRYDWKAPNASHMRDVFIRWHRQSQLQMHDQLAAKMSDHLTQGVTR